MNDQAMSSLRDRGGLSGLAASSPNEIASTVHLFSEIESNGLVSQDTLATRLGVAVGLTNAYIRRCIRKGLIKVQRAPARRYAYYLTPLGFFEKARLTSQYLVHSFSFFRQARRQCSEIMLHAKANGWNRILLFGTGELAEVVVLASLEIPEITLVGVVARGRNSPKFAGLTVFDRLEHAQAFDAVMVTDTLYPHETYAELRGKFQDERILLAPLLHIVRPKASDTTA